MNFFDDGQRLRPALSDLLVLKKSATEGVLRRWPRTGRGLDQLKRLIERCFLRKAQVWVRIQSGLSMGMWMHLHFPREALIWRGKHEPEVQNAIQAVVRQGDRCL